MTPVLRKVRVVTLTVIAWFVFIAFLLEIYSRLAFESNSYGVHQLSEIVYEEEVGWIGRANLRAPSQHGLYPVAVPVSINSDGFRDKDWDEKLQRVSGSHAKKILLIGDSMLYGWGSDSSERLTESLAHRYRLANVNAEIFNAGIPAYGASQERRLLPRLLERIKPDIVLLLFCWNDYGDTALPYDHRYPATRVYKPFYDPQGVLVINDVVPRRPSLYVRDSFLGTLRLWDALDVFYYAFQDIAYKSRGVPGAKDFPVPIHRLDDLAFQDNTHPTFQRVERTVMELYRNMNTITRQHGASFFIVNSDPSTEHIIGSKITDMGIDLISLPKEYRSYLPWTYIYNDGHPNFLWAWILSSAIFRHVEGKPSTDVFADMPSYGSIPSELTLNRDDLSAKYISGTWGPPEAKARWALEGGNSRTGTTPHFILRVPNAPKKEARVKVVAWMQFEQELVLSDYNGRRLCRWNMVPDVYDYECMIETDRNGLLLGELMVSQRSVPDTDVPRQESYVRLAAIFSIAVE